MTQWFPLDILDPVQENSIAYLKLNSPLNSGAVTLFKLFWRKAKLKVMVDGAANNIAKCIGLDPGQFIPDIIAGDFDSVDENVLSFYKEKGAEIIPLLDQSKTDFTKCMEVVLEKIGCGGQVDAVVAHSYLHDRLDHVFGNIQTLYLLQPKCPVPLYLLSGKSLSFLLKEGDHTIHVPRGLRGTHCGLIPVGQSCTVTTTGLCWNLDNEELKFGGLVSTSNTWTKAESVQLKTSHPLLWTMEIK